MTPRRYITALDGIRGMGIFFVLAYHYLLMKDYQPTILGFSWVWIQMFFVQSGYLITDILLGTRELPFRQYIVGFYRRRIFRIFPLYFGYLFVAALVFAATREPADFPLRAPFLVSFTTNAAWMDSRLPLISVPFVHFWSLAVEEQFYFVWPWLVFFLSRPTLRAVLIAAAVFSPVFRYLFAIWLHSHGYPETTVGLLTYTFTPGQIDAFAFGAAIPLFNLQDRIRNPGRWAAVACGLLMTVGLVNLTTLRLEGVAMSRTSLGLSVGMLNHLQHVWSYTLTNATFMFVTVYLISPSYRGVFTNPFLVRTGKMVFGMYVIHAVVLSPFARLAGWGTTRFVLGFIAGSAVVWVLAAVSYRWFETPFIRRRSLTANRERGE